MRKAQSPDMRIVNLGEAIRPSAAVVTIDVVRAFSCTALAFERGAEEITCVRSLDEARVLGALHPQKLLMGEERGLKPEGFDIGNSPHEVQMLDLAGKSLIQRTSNGTRGLIEAIHAPLLFAAGAVNATATAKILEESGTREVDFLVTDPATSEDRACARFMIDTLLGNKPDPAELTKTVLGSFAEHRALWHRVRTTEEIADFENDVTTCAQVDRCIFAVAGRVIDLAEGGIQCVTLTKS